MITALVTAVLRFRVLVIGAAVLVLGLGLTQLPKASVDTWPEFSPVQVQVQTDALGLSAAEVEQLITVPLEQDLLNGVAWLDQITSESMPGLSSIDMTFEPGTDPLQARQLVQERMTQAHALPNVGSPPVMLQPLSSTSRVMMISLSSKNLSLVDMSVLARWKIKPRLLGVPGVANVAIWGQRDRQLQVQVDPERLRKYGVSLDQVITTAGNALWVSPLTFVQASTPGTGGFIDTSTQRFGIQHVQPITTANQLSSVSLEDSRGRTLRLGDVSSVVEDHQPLIGDAVLDGDPGLMLVVERFPEANSRDVTRGVEDALAALRPGLSGIDVNPTVYRSATFIDTSLHNVGVWALVAFPLLLFVLLACFRSWGAALVTFLTALVSLTAAAYALFLLGTAFNLVLLAGLTAALVVIIDDGVIAVHSIRDRSRLQRATGSASSPFEMVAAAARHVRGSLFFAALIVLLAPLPAMVWGGTARSFTWPFVLAYAVAVMASTVVSLTVGPALGLLLLRGRTSERRTGRLLRNLDLRFERWVRRFVRSARPAQLTLAMLTLAGLVVLPQLGSASVLPSLHDPELLVHWKAAPGTSLQEMTRVTSAAVHELWSLSGVRSAGAHVGRAVTSDQAVNVNSAELWVRIDDNGDYAATRAAVQRVVSGYPGLRSDLLTYPQDRIRAAVEAEAPVVVRVYGQDQTMLQSKADEIRRVISSIPGVAQPKTQARSQEPVLQVEVDLAAAQRYGIRPGDLRRAAATFFSGVAVGSLYEDQKVFDVVVRGAPGTRSSPNSVANLLLQTPRGDPVRLGDIATARVSSQPTLISHDATSPSLDVTADISGRSAASVIHDVEQRVRTVAMPFEYHAEILGSAAANQQLMLRVAGVSFAVVVAILLLLQAVFSSWRLATLTLLLLPAAVAGAVLTAPIAGGIASVGPFAACLMVLTITIRHLILFVRSCQAREQEGAALGADLVVMASREQLGPFVVSTLAIAAVFIPLVALGSRAGTEVLFSQAVPLLGGLLTSAVITLLIAPALYLRFSPGARTSRPGHRARWLAGPVAGATLLLAGCGSAAAPVAPTSAAAAARVTPIEGSDVSDVELTEEAASRLGLETSAVRELDAPRGGSVTRTIPMSAVIYDKDGRSWVYVAVGPLTFERERVDLGLVDGDVGELRSGPAPGTRVVTVGAAELFGAEIGVDGE